MDERKYTKKKKKKKIWNKAYNKIMQFTPLQQNPQELTL